MSCYFNPAESNTVLLKAVKQMLREIKKEEDLSVLHKAFIEQSKKLSEGYTNPSDIAPIIEDITKRGFSGLYEKLSSIFPKLGNILAAKGQAFDDLLKSTVDKYPTEEEKVNEAADAKEYLTQAYGEAIEVRALAERQIKFNVVKYGIVNRETGTSISSDAELNASLNEYHKQLWDTVVDYLVAMSPNSAQVELDLRNTDHRLGLGKLNQYAKNEFNKSLLADKYAYYKIKKSATRYIDAYNALVTLNHFDSFVTNKFIKVKENLIGQETLEDKYYFAGTGANTITTWRDDNKDIELASEVSDVIKMIIETMPIYVGDSPQMRTFGLNELLYITSRIKALVYNPKYRGNTLVTIGKIIETNPKFMYLRQQYDEDMPFISLIRSSGKNAQVKYRQVLEIMCDDKVGAALFGQFSPTQRTLLHSLYKNVFEKANHSLYGIFTNNPTSNGINYYAALVHTMLSVDHNTFLQYKIDDNNNVIQTNMSDALKNDSRRRKEREINGVHSKIAKEIYKKLKETYNPSFNEDEKAFHINYTDHRTGSKVDITYSPVVNGISISINGETLSTIRDLNDWNALKGLIGDMFIINFNDINIESGILDTFRSNEATDFPSLTQLVGISSSILFNSYFNNEVLDDSVYTVSELKGRLSGLLGTTWSELTKLGYSIPSLGIEINAFNSKGLPLLGQVASAYDIASGKYASGMNKDGSGNMVNSIGITKLSGNVMMQREEIIGQTNNNPTKGFSLYNDENLMRGVGFSRDFVGKTNIKKVTKFNSKEFMDSSFLTNFMSVKYKSDDTRNNQTHSKYTAIFPSPISDKSQILHVLLNLEALVPAGQIGHGFTKAGGEKSRQKMYKDLTAQEVKEIARQELGTFYTRVIQNMESDWASLSEFAVNNGFTALNPRNNFADWNTEYGEGGVAKLHDLIVMAQHSGLNIELIDQTHFIDNKGLLQRNDALYAEADKHATLESSQAFWEQQDANFIQSLLREGWRVNLFKANGSEINSPEITALRGLSSWVDLNLGRMVIAKLHIGNSVINLTNITQLKDLMDINSKDFDLYKEMKAKGYTLEVHPELDQFNSMQYLFGQEYILSTVGHVYNHPDKKWSSRTDPLLGEAARLAQQHKRNVSQTASKHPFLRGLLNGIRSTYKIAVIEDDATDVFNLINSNDKGKPQQAKQFDGATFAAPDTVYLENLSLLADCAGMDKKPFIHTYNASTGSGVIIKTASFALTNARIRNSGRNSISKEVKGNIPGFSEYSKILQDQFYKRMVRNMWKEKWTDRFGEYNPGVYDITKDVNNNNIIYKDIFFRGNKDFFGDLPFEYDIYYQVKGITKLEGDNYSLDVWQVDKNGNDIKQLKPIIKTIDSKYSLWQAFGGEFSMSINATTQELEFSEASIENVVTASNKVGEITSGNCPKEIVNGKTLYYPETQDDMYQPLKESGLQYVVTGGAIKQGGANINSKRAYYDDSYELATMQISMVDAGIQLNAEHHADDSVLSLMTQVVNALSARGYMNEEADEVYEALRGITEDALSGYEDELGNLLSLNDSKFKDTMVQTIVDSLKRSTGRDGNLIQSMADSLVSKAKRGHKVSYNEAFGQLPLSHPGVFDKVASILTSALSKSAINMKFRGSMAVLNPAKGICKLHGNRFYGQYLNDADIEMEQYKYNSKPITNPGELRLFRSYRLLRNVTGPISIDMLNQGKLIELKSPQEYWDLKEMIKQANASEEVLTFVEDIREGRDLSEYNFTFMGSDGRIYNMWDLDIVKEIYNWDVDADIAAYKEAKAVTSKLLSNRQFEEAEEAKAKALSLLTAIQEKCSRLGITTNILNLNKYTLRRELQRSLEAVGTGVETTVIIEGKPIIVEKGTLNVQAYEVIMPKIYAERFGLSTSDNLEDIRTDKMFFTKRLANNWKSTVPEGNYHIALKRANGKHVYLMSTDDAITEGMTLKQVTKSWKGDKLSVLDPISGKPRYRLSEEADQVYLTANNEEVIVTKNLRFFLENYNYNEIIVSKGITDAKLSEKILAPVLDSDKTEVKNLAELLFDEEDMNLTLSNIRDEQNSAIEAILDNDVANAISNGNRSISRIIKNGSNLHTSFLKSLDVLAARIPAQSMQSFMPMKVVAFDDSNLNSAYVNHMQFWLQGSDLDIDKVNLLGYEFDNSGKFIGWSPYFIYSDEEGFRLSEKLPFPSGVELIFDIDEDAAPLPDVNSLQSNPRLLAVTLRSIRKNNGHFKVKDAESEQAKAFKKYIDRHNLYIKNNSHQKVEMLKNFVSTYMFKISSDPISLIQSQSPIDEPVDILKSKGSQSITEQWDAADTAGNFMGMVKALVKNMVGKDCVAISASGMKTVEGLTHYFGKRLRDSGNIRQSFLVSDKVICGHHISMLANAWTDSIHKSLLPQEVKDALDSVDQDSDALLLISALLGAAVDNAKDPILGKINGGSNMLPLYIYGIAMGVNFDDLAECMMSTTARNIAHLMEGNIFQDVKSMSLKESIRYIKEGPRENTISSKGIIKELEEALPVDDESSTSFGMRLIANIDRLQGVIDNIRKAHQGDNKNDRINANRALEEISDWMGMYLQAQADEYFNSNQVKYKAIDALTELAAGASEFKAAQPMYGLNKQVPTDPVSLVNFIERFENIFNLRINELSEEEKSATHKYITETGAVGIRQVSGEKDGVQGMLDTFPPYEDGKENPYFRISFIKFMQDEAYRQDIIDRYEEVKHSVNIFDAIMSSPHYAGYMKATYAAVQELGGSLKFRKMRELLPYISRMNKITSYQKPTAIKQLKRFIDTAINNKWLRSYNTAITIPAGVAIGEFTTTTEPTTLLLGRNETNAAFKYWMESKVIPDLRQGILGENSKNGNLPYNRFIKGIQANKLDRTLSEAPMFTYIPGINTMPRTDFEKSEFQLWKSDFNKLFTGQYGTYNGMNIGELFFYYNTVVFDNAPGQSTFSSLFEDLYLGQTSSAINNYMQFISRIDFDSDLIEDVDYSLEDVLIATAPRYDYRQGSPAYFKYKDRSRNNIRLFKAKEKDSSEFNGYYDFEDEGGEYDIIDYYGGSYDNEWDEDVQGVDDDESEGSGLPDSLKEVLKKYDEVQDSITKDVPWGYSALGNAALDGVVEISPEYSLRLSDAGNGYSTPMDIFYKGNRYSESDILKEIKNRRKKLYEELLQDMPPGQIKAYLDGVMPELKMGDLRFKHTIVSVDGQNVYRLDNKCAESILKQIFERIC